MASGSLLSLLLVAWTQVGCFGGSHSEASPSKRTSGRPLLINGAGASFPFPLYAHWFSSYREVDPSLRINYQSIGSGGGIRQFLAGTTDFGATDAPMTEEELAQARNQVLHVPTALGAVVVTYNLPELGGEEPLHLSGPLIAQIFMGRVTNWSDPQIQELNPKLTLPDRSIITAHRSDGSGTTAVFTDYLAQISPEWAETVGKGKAVRFPTGLGGKGNEGVTSLVRQNPGSIGYVEFNYALINQMRVAALLTDSETVVRPTVESITLAAESALSQIPEDFRVSIVNPQNPKAYPIAAFTYFLLHSPMDPVKGEKLMSFIQWAMGPGQEAASGLGYAPLPAPLVERVLSSVRSIELL